MSRIQAKKNKFTSSNPIEKYENIFKSIIAGKTHRGKTFSYLDILNHPSMKGKKLFIIATDTVSNIEKNINLSEYKSKKPQIEFLSDEDGNPVQITKSVKYCEDAIKYAINKVKNDKDIKAVVIDNYDNLEEMYINEEVKKKASGRLMPYEYGRPRANVYFKYIKPFLVMDNVHFFLTADVVEVYFDGNPTGTFDMNIPYKRRKHFSEWIWIDAKWEDTPKEEKDVIVKKWKGIKKPISIGNVNKVTEVAKIVEGKINE